MTLGNSEPDANPLWVSEGENDAAARRLAEDSMSELFSVSFAEQDFCSCASPCDSQQFLSSIAMEKLSAPYWLKQISEEKFYEEDLEATSFLDEAASKRLSMLLKIQT
ncbi:MAG: hypothetical protein S4CHLAM81_04810 [Chlamydiales bacterium]|nr:hypothetical protein [Chlamydiales bacterium]MCH9635270.1 hypothetical protein [Chlamydiales bacterium]